MLWVIAAFVVGFCFGFIAAALFVASKQGEDNADFIEWQREREYREFQESMRGRT